MSGGRLYTIRARLGDEVYIGRSMLPIEPVAGDVVEYAGEVRVAGQEGIVYVELELIVLRRRINVAGGAPVIDAEVSEAQHYSEAKLALERLRFTPRAGA